MRGWFSIILAVTFGGALVAGCGSDDTNADLWFKCSENSVEHGATVTCNRFGTSTAAYQCVTPGDVTLHGLYPLPRASDTSDTGTTSAPNAPTNASGSQCPTGTVPNERPGGQNPRADKNDAPESSDAPPDSDNASCDDGYHCTGDGSSTACICTKCEAGYHAVKGTCVPKGNNGVGNGVDPPPPGNPPVNDGPGTSPGNPGNKQHGHDAKDGRP